MKRWLEQTPTEKVPELQLILDDRWMYRADRALIAEQDYRSVSAMLRADGEMKMSTAIADALKQFAKNGGGPFPADVEALKPYFSAPIDDSMLQRWQVVPARTLIPFLAETGGDWVITQRTPVNRQFDSRMAIGLTGSRGTSADGRWDPVP